MDIIDRIEKIIGEEIKAKRTPASKKSYADKYYRIKKTEVLNKKKELDASAEGKVRKRMKPILKKGRRSPTSRHKVEYNV